MNSRLLNVPAILFAVLTVSIGMYVYNSSQATITDSMESLSTQEVDAFNSQFYAYEGTQTGSNIKALVSRLIANANTYIDETDKIPGVVIEQLTENETIEQIIVDPFEIEDEASEYIQKLNEIRNNVSTKHEYFVEISYQSKGIVDYIYISYDESNPITDYRNR